MLRSEERRVGKECRSRRWEYHHKIDKRVKSSTRLRNAWKGGRWLLSEQQIFCFKQKTAYEIGLGIPAEPLFRSLDEEKWLNMLGTFVKDWFRYESHFVHGRDSLVDILKERGLLSESDAVQPLIGKKS